MDSASHHHGHTTLRLNIKSRGQLSQFLREVQPRFLEMVDPRKSDLRDILYAAHLLTDTDQESLSGKDVNTRKDQARKLWFLLNKMSVLDFVSKVAPVLIKEFRHIIPAKYLTQEMIDVTAFDAEVTNYCLRHDIMGRIRAATMADLLYHHDRLKLEDYEEVASDGCEAGAVWTEMFRCCQGDDDDSSPSSLVPNLRALLEKYRLQVPENLGQLVASGIPCACNARDCVLPAPSPSPLRKVGSWVKKCVWDWRTPTGSNSSLSSEDILTSYGDRTFPAEPGECRGSLTTVGGECSSASASPLIHKLMEPAAQDVDPSPAASHFQTGLKMEESQLLRKPAVPESVCIPMCDPADPSPDHVKEDEAPEVLGESDNAAETEIHVRKQEAFERIKKIADDFSLAFGISGTRLMLIISAAVFFLIMLSCSISKLHFIELEQRIEKLRVASELHFIELEQRTEKLRVASELHFIELEQRTEKLRVASERTEKLRVASEHFFELEQRIEKLSVTLNAVITGRSSGNCDDCCC